MITNIIFRRSDSPITSDKPHYENVPFEVPSSWIWSTVNEINMYNSKNVDPAKQKENTFELYSVPIFPTNTPEIIKGEKIGSLNTMKENIKTMYKNKCDIQFIAKVLEQSIEYVQNVLNEK